MKYIKGSTGQGEININSYDPNQPRYPKGSDTGGQWRKSRSPQMSSFGSKEEFRKLVSNPDDFVDFILTKIPEDYSGSVGLRGLYKDEKIGKMKPSKVWEDGNQLDEVMDGTSAVGISSNFQYSSRDDLISVISKYANEVFKYGDGRVGLVISTSVSEQGNDYWANEIIVPDAQLIYIWQ